MAYTNLVSNFTLKILGWFYEGLITQTLIVHMIRTQNVPSFSVGHPGNYSLALL